jgi:uncharacterized protein YdbL (DUF1318 family)
MIRSFSHALAALLLALVLTVSDRTARADALDDAKAQGLVGEQADGYVGAVEGAGGVQALIDEINAKRKAAYADIAAQRGAPTEAVAQIAGKKLIERTPKGQFVRGSNGQWTER